jgi:Na+/glutamate symporter
MSSIGGVGTTLAWAPMFVEEFGIANAFEIGVVSNTVGLIAACVIGGSISNDLFNKHKISPSNEEDVTVGAFQESETRTELSHYGVYGAADLGSRWTVWLYLCGDGYLNPPFASVYAIRRLLPDGVQL